MQLAEFDFISALFGGALLGLSAAILMFFNGRIAGVSGVFGQMLVGREIPWRASWIGGLLVGGFASIAVAPELFGAPVQQSFVLLLLAGFLVGLGTRIGSGCTSGHGICGLARFSLRSLVATLSFIGAGAITVVVARSIGWLP
jgi:uncharacterized membrane protein YedE/YeeE